MSAFSSLGAGAAAVCAWEFGRWCRCCVRLGAGCCRVPLLCALGSLGAGAAAGQCAFAVCSWRCRESLFAIWRLCRRSLTAHDLCLTAAAGCVRGRAGGCQRGVESLARATTL